MATVKQLLTHMETRTLVWLARSRTSSLMIVGALAAAGLGAVAVGGQSTTEARKSAPVVSSSSVTLPMSSYGCYNDPDGDGHIFCDASVPLAQLPAAYGQCYTRHYGPAAIVCRGTGSDW